MDCREEFDLFINFDMTTGINQLISTQSTAGKAQGLQLPLYSLAA